MADTVVEAVAACVVPAVVASLVVLFSVESTEGSSGQLHMAGQSFRSCAPTAPELEHANLNIGMQSTPSYWLLQSRSAVAVDTVVSTVGELDGESE